MKGQTVNYPGTHSFDRADSHVHFPHPFFLRSFCNVLFGQDVGACNAVCVPHPSRLSVVPDALYLKAHHPEKIYVSGSMDFSVFLTDPKRIGERFARYVDLLLGMGCDGVKMWEGKPDIRKHYAIPPFDSDLYEPYWRRLEEKRIPVVFHINYPDTYWHRDRAPAYVFREGWFFGDGTFVNNEVQYREAYAVMRRHPDLRVIFAHFHFFSYQLARLGEWLDRFPNMHVDLAPGSEMYRGFSEAPDETRDFFLRFSDRILYGTDYGAGAMLEDLRHGQPIIDGEREIPAFEAKSTFALVRTFLEATGDYSLKDQMGAPLWDLPFPLKAIGLPSEALEAIYRGNFARLFGQRPRRLDPAAIVAECYRLIETIGLPGTLLPGRVGDASVARMVKAFFESKTIE